MNENPSQSGGYGDPPTQPQYPYQPGQPPWQSPQGPPPKQPRSWKRKLLTAAGVVIALVVVASILGSVLGRKTGVTKAAGTPSASSSAPASTAPGTPSASPSASLTGPVGTTFTDTWSDATTNTSGSYDVTAVRVIDPAAGTDQFNQPSPGDRFNQPSPGDRFVAVEFRIKGDAGYSHDDSNGDASVMGSDGQSYSPVFDTVTAGTNFNGGDFGVSAGQAEVGYVVFQLPQGVAVASVQWQPGGSFSSSQPATWTVSS